MFKPLLDHLALLNDERTARDGSVGGILPTYRDMTMMKISSLCSIQPSTVVIIYH